ncbi:MAG TPA: restriction endonuclease [Planktothrix sp.]|jgi:hypothetical protein
MDADRFQKSVEYEQLTQEIYQQLLNQEPGGGKAERDVDVQGRSGVKHQIDVLWRFKKAGVEHLVLVECKHYSSNITLEKVRSFFGVLHDIGHCHGIMVTKTGFQSGAEQFARFYGIDLKLVRKPTQKDFEGYIKTVHITQVNRATSHIGVHIRITDPASDRFRKPDGTLTVPLNPETYPFYDQNKTPTTTSVWHWIATQINNDAPSKQQAGCYKLRVPTEGYYILFDEGLTSETLVKVDWVDLSYNVYEQKRTEFTIDAEEITEAILKDVPTGELQHVKHVEGFKWDVQDNKWELEYNNNTETHRLSCFRLPSFMQVVGQLPPKLT